MKVKIDIDIKTFITFFAVAAGFVLLAYLVVLLKTPLLIIFIAFFLAIALNPPVTKLARLIPGHSRLGATALAYIVVLAALGGLIVLAVPPAIKQSISFIQQVPGYIEVLQDNRGPFNNFLEEYGLEGQVNAAIDNAKDRTAQLARSVGSTFVSGVSAALNGLIVLLTLLVLTFLMLIEGPSWLRRFWGVYIDQSKKERHQRLARRMYHVVTAYVNGQVLIAFIAAVCALIVLLMLTTFLNVPLNAVVPLASIVLVTSMIPMVGSTIGGAIITIALLFNDVTAAVIFLVYFIIYQQVENNVVQPVVQSKSVELSALAVIIAVILGISLAGIIGALVAIPIAGALRILVNEYLEQRRAQAIKQPENMLHKVKKLLKNDADKASEDIA